MIYLDFNASTPILKAAHEAMIKTFDCVGNPSSVHSHGKNTRKILEQARAKIAVFFDIPTRNITFTSGATEANNLIIKGFNGPVLISAIEHDSILKAHKDALTIPVNDQGIVDTCSLEKLLFTNQNALVCVQAVNNETGVIQPIPEILKICQKYKSHLHIDAAQCIGKTTLNWGSLPSFAISAHKFGGPKGIGAVIINQPLELTSLITGGGQERGLRAGTENIIGAAGMGAAIEKVFDFEQLKPLQHRLETEILKICPTAMIFSNNVKRVSNTTLVAMPKVSSEVQLMHFDLNGISLSSGSACSSGKVKTSHVLTAMGILEQTAKCTIRISTGWTTTEHEIDQCIAVWAQLHNAQNKTRQK